MKLAQSSPEIEGFFQAAKWTKLSILCDAQELAALFSLLEPFSIFLLSSIGTGEELSKPLFLNTYGAWIEALKQGNRLDRSIFKQILSSGFIREDKDVWLQEIAGKGFLVKPRKPILQVHAHFFSYSREDGVFRSMSVGKNSVFWGLQFSFPQVYQEGKTEKICEVKRGALFPVVQKWAREYSLPTPFIVDGKQTNSTMRLGKACFPWIANHPELQIQNLCVKHA